MQVLFQQLTVIQKSYQTILETGMEIFELLKKKDLENIKDLQMKQFKAMDKLNAVQGEFEQHVTKLSEKYKVSEPRVKYLIPLLKGENRKKMQDVYDNVIKIEHDAKAICVQNGDLLKVLLDLSEDVIGWLSEYHEKHGHDSQLFIDETL